MRTVTIYLIVNGRGDCRINRRRPALAYDEVAYQIRVNVPSGWGRIYEAADITLPDAPLAARPLEIGNAEQDIDSAEAE